MVVFAMLFAIILLGVMAWLSLSRHEPGRHRLAAGMTQRIPRPADLPGSPEEMMAAKAPATILPPVKARALNDQVAFVTDKGPAARPFHFSGGVEDRGRARDCLAAAALYEAGGGDGPGQDAVMQVVLNRARHPAFPHSICGAVFQGSERTTGCQFTFACDGSIGRAYSTAAWTSARARASAFLDGRVAAAVGLATHYHTNWVYPYWSSSLVKLAQVNTHLFFRWKGYWGTRAAFANRLGANEPRIALLAPYAPSHRTDGDVAIAGGAGTAGIAGLPGIAEGQVAPPQRHAIDASSLSIPASSLRGAQILFVHPQGGAYLIAIPATMTKAIFARAGAALCAAQDFCRVQAWTAADLVPRGYPVSASAKQTMRFQYVRASGKDEADITE